MGHLAGRASEVRRLTGDLEIEDGETRRLLGWDPLASPAEAMRLTAAWFKSR
jgi:hypothetical protein